MQELNSLIDFSKLKSQQDTSNAFKKARSFINSSEKGEPDKQVVKRRSHEFLKFIHAHLSSDGVPSQSKFYTLSILKLATQNDERTILSVLSNHALFRYLVTLAKSTDPDLPIDKKGKNIFQDPKLGNNYIRLILESIRVWGERFSSNKKNESSKYKKAYDELVKLNIALPKELVFYDTKLLVSASGLRTTTTSELAETKMSQGVSRNFSQEGPRQPQTQNGKIMEYDINQIHEFIKKLDQNEYQKYCHEYHKLFQKQKEKYESIIGNLLAANKQKELNTAFALNDFYMQEDEAYNKFLSKNEDFYSYVNLIQLKADELFASTKKTPQTREVIKKEVTTETKTVRGNNMVQESNLDAENKMLISELISKMDLSSKAIPTSFKNIKESLSKDKSLSRGRSIDNTKKSSSMLTISKSIGKSRIAQIFNNPPNAHPQDKRYQGELIPTNRDLERTMKEITKNQGHRRFITSSFKNKNPLFENSHVQIGFKSQAIYEEVNEFWAVLSIELFIGNKTESQISKLAIDYKGESNMLLYGSPKNVQNYLFPGLQTKQELLIAPLDNKPSLIKMYLIYQVNDEMHEERIILPNSILKFSQNRKLSKKEFVQHWNGSGIYKTGEFKLSKYISPDSLGKYIGMLEELSDYNRFVEPGSETDYEVGCEVILKKKYEGVLRISIRPNLNAVIQIGIMNNSQEAYEAFVSYVQSLQMILSNVESI